MASKTEIRSVFNNNYGYGDRVKKERKKRSFSLVLPCPLYRCHIPNGEATQTGVDPSSFSMQNPAISREYMSCDSISESYM